jgi:peptide/nickel transport system permease protein
MTAYLTRRLLSLLPVLLFLSIVLFAMQYVLPGDPVAVIVGQTTIDPQVEQQIRRDLLLDRPLPVQYGHWLWGALHGDLGRSYRSHEPVLTLIRARIPVTLQLAGAAWLIGLIGIPLGVIAATHHNQRLDVGASVVSLLGISVPSFWLGILLIWLFGVRLHWLPPSGYTSLTSDPIDGLRHLALPAITLGVAAAAVIMRQTRSAMLEVLRQDFVTTARAKGLEERRVISRHALKNALLPVVTLLGLQVARLLGGTVVIEQVFAIPGLGRLAVSSINLREVQIVQGVVMVAACAVLLCNLVVDMLYVVLDPRIRVG